MPWQIYNILHFVGITMVILSFGAIFVQQFANNTTPIKHRRMIMASHGIGLLITLIAGFGMMAKKLNMLGGGWPLWIWLKLVIWIALGAGVSIALRKPYWSRVNWFIVVALVGAAAYVAIYKPM